MINDKQFSGFFHAVLNHLSQSATIDKLEQLPINIYNDLIEEIDNGYEEE